MCLFPLLPRQLAFSANPSCQRRLWGIARWDWVFAAFVWSGRQPKVTAQICVHVCTVVTCVHTQTQKHTQILIHAYTHTRAHTHTYACTHVEAHTHTHTHPQNPFPTKNLLALNYRLSFAKVINTVLGQQIFYCCVSSLQTLLLLFSFGVTLSSTLFVVGCYIFWPTDIFIGGV